jgi:leader peptidase (prepilin peptidase) / N-methyltransferase
MVAMNTYLVEQFMVLVAGCCLGSFYNVVVHRLPAKESLVSPGSHCPHCSHPIAYYDNVPLLSYILLRGKCRYCRAPISARYPLIEALTGFLGLLLFRHYGLHPQLFIELFFVSLLIVIAFIDLDTYLIPDVLSISGVVAGFALSFLTPRLTWWDSLLGIFLGGGFLYLIAVGYQFVRHQEGLGGGDIKLLGMIGAFVGWPGVVFTVLAASIMGTAVGGVVMWRTRKGLATMLPFGPFLSAGAIAYIFWGEEFYRWYLGTLTG